MTVSTMQRSALPMPGARAVFRFCAAVAAALLFAPAWAQENAIQSIVANQLGGNVIVRIGFRNPVSKPPVGFSTAAPARIALDFPGVENATGKNLQEINLGDVRNVAIAQSGGRARLVFNLQRGLNYATAVEQNAVIVTIAGAGAAATATAANAGGQPVQAAPAAVPVAAQDMLKDIEFRQGSAGEGRIVIELPGKQTAVDVRQQGQTVVVDFLKTGVPEALRRRLDVSQFATPVSAVTTQPRSDGARMVIEPRGLWEHSAYQTDNQLVVEIKPIKEDPNRLGAGVRAYRGDKISLNFQNIEVRQILAVLAEHSGLNIIASDSVGGTLTLLLKEVPWDQALDIVMQSKGLDMRRNGNVMLIAPKEELLTKEKLELEQRAQIADLEPLRTEVFQLNYQKAENFKNVFGLDAAAGGGAASGRSILSKRGSATSDPRTNKLFVTDIAAKLEEVRKLIQLTDVASRQVVIEARVVEANDTFSRTLGAKLGFADLRTIRGGDSGYSLGSSTTTRAALTGNLAGVGEQTGQTAVSATSYNNSQFVNLPAQGLGGTTPGSLAVSLFSAAANRFLNLELSALEADGKGKIISSPRVVATDQQRAVMEDGEEIPFQRATSSGATSVEFRKASLRLEVTPQITPDGMIILEVDISKDSRGNPTPGGFAINTKHVTTNVHVENGGTVVLGGVYTQTELNGESKVPFLGDIPVLGRLFKSTLRTNDKTELLIFITPKIVAEQVQVR
jgi:type IV pilus assembly protein PilQ